MATTKLIMRYVRYYSTLPFMFMLEIVQEGVLAAARFFAWVGGHTILSTEVVENEETGEIAFGINVKDYSDGNDNGPDSGMLGK